MMSLKIKVPRMQRVNAELLVERLKKNLPDVIILGCVFVLYVVVYYACLHPKMVTRSFLIGEIETTEGYISKAKKKLVSLRKEIDEIKKGEQGDKAKKAPDFSVSRNKYELAKELQESLNKKASEIGVSITRFSVGGTKRANGYCITTVSVAFTGDVKGLVNVLRMLDGYGYVRVKRLSVRRSYSSRGGGNLRIDMTIEGLSKGG